jgi:hypothetical protein
LILAIVRKTCIVGAVVDPRLLRACAALVAAEVLPQAARWHRRDLSPSLVAAWRAALRAISPSPLSDTPSSAARVAPAESSVGRSVQRRSV